MQINVLLNIKNKKIKLNNIHYKLNVFQKNILNQHNGGVGGGGG